MAQFAAQAESRVARKTSVAIIGTGLAGLTTAHLLQNDKQQRYRVTLFEQADTLSFDAASVAIRNEKTRAVERIDLPMRACAGGYYANLMRMYAYLGIPLHPVRFLFVFAKPLSTSQSRPCEATRPGDAGSAPGSYFVHASNLHQTPPPWPANRGLVPHVVEILYLIICHFWFSAVCFLVPPITTARPQPRGSDGPVSEGGETFAEYLKRTWLPRRYVSHYLLPLMSSVSTCDHADLLAFPASDVVNYKKLSHGQQHYAVCGGVHQVQSRLARGMDDIRLASRVVSVEEDDGRVLVRWQSKRDTDGHVALQCFDRVVLAVSPDVAGRIFSPLATTLERMPTKRVESSVLSPQLGDFSLAGGEDLSRECSHHGDDASPSQVITFRTLFSENGSRTEALHAMPGGVLVSTSPLEPTTHSKAMLQTAKFTRTLRTPQSRAITQRIMGLNRPDAVNEKTDGSSQAGWVNGEGSVWLTGSWCWDGMVLLEGCVVSAMRVAEDFGVGVPWQDGPVRA
ncbi:Uncharacterized protein TPAR_02726 [Tolypocladium paradoxum]|uniref:Amine oxidase domain-containing protein n=1 Tax=Tolypocladium paradoxum TaxID=94208 RepID=A0A2S4L3R5_9HYPO|nr:Uncharacterized protein TPAR_02726 [Tolypocladium paradoxum]